jgi:hypothetical protein
VGWGWSITRGKIERELGLREAEEHEREREKWRVQEKE